MEREAWGDAAQVYPDGFNKVWLLARVDEWSELSYVFQQLTYVPTMTYDQGRALVMKILDNKRKAMEIEQHRKNELLRITGIPLQTQLSLPSQPPPPPLLDSSVSTFYANRVVGDSGFKCHNCEMPDHAAKDCKQLWCNKCGSKFAFFGCNGYHNYTDCPLWTRKRSATGEAGQYLQQPRMTFQQSTGHQQSTQRSHQYYPQRGQQSTTRQANQQQQYSQRVQQSATMPVSQSSGARRPWNSNRLQQPGPSSRFAGHAGALDDPIYDDALEAVGIQDMSLEQAQAFSARIQSYNASAAAIVNQAQSEDEDGAERKEYTQPWEHADSDF